MKAADRPAAGIDSPAARAPNRRGVSFAIRRDIEGSRRYIEMVVWLFLWAAQAAPFLLIWSLILNIFARATIMLGFIWAVRAMSLVISADHRRQALAQLGHFAHIGEGLFVALIALGVGVVLLTSGLATRAKRRCLNRLATKLSTRAQELLSNRFQAELLHPDIEVKQRKPLYALYANSFENQLLSALKLGVAGIVDMFAALVLVLITILIVAWIDWLFFLFLVIIIVAYAIFSVRFSYGTHLASTKGKRQRSEVLRQKVLNLHDAFVHADEETQKRALERFSKLKAAAQANEGSNDDDDFTGSYLARILKFLSDPANSQIAMTTPVFLFLIVYTYHLSLKESVSVISTVTSLFVARFVLSFAANVISEARRFSLRYKNIRLYYMISVKGEPLIPQLNAATPTVDSKDEDDVF